MCHLNMICAMDLFPDVERLKKWLVLEQLAHVQYPIIRIVRKAEQMG